MSRCVSFILALGLAVSAVPAHSDTFTPSHSCSKPYKPYQFDSEWELENFKDDVEDYKDCVSDFVDEQNEAIRKHKNAAEEAIDEWNTYVNIELN